MSKIFVARIAYSTSVDGVGLRNSLYVSGCNIHCKGCHNKQWWPINSGKEMEIEDVYQNLNTDDFNISILGGEPLLQYEAVTELCRLIKSRTKKTIWLWTGFEMKQIQDRFPDLLNYVDVVVDGPFKEELKDLSLCFRGSSNQKIYSIDHLRENIAKDISDQF